MDVIARGPFRHFRKSTIVSTWIPRLILVFPGLAVRLLIPLEQSLRQLF